MDKYTALILYKDDKCLDEFLKEHIKLSDEDHKQKEQGEQIYETEYCQIICVKGIDIQIRYILGKSVDYIAIQEELTWREDWKDIKFQLNSIKRNQILPTGICVFNDCETYII